jgi:nucleotide-binding universal stress UspA family protein
MYRSIVVGTDGSETATEAVRRAGTLARAADATVHVVSAYEPRALKLEGGADKPELAQPGIGPKASVEALLEDAAGAVHALGVTVERYARRGDPAEAILDVADEQQADLIIVGNKGMRGARRFLLGSVPDKISHHAGCSVMIVHTQG